MAYFTPYIDSAGLHIPTYIDIRDDLIEQAKSIYGQDIYLENDSMDYQYISAFALKTYDTLQALQYVYNNRSPSTAIGSALDGIVKINGIQRKAASYSTCEVTLTGIANTVITNGIVADTASYEWALPATTKIGVGGSVSVTATCQTIGEITATIGTITTIVTPTHGWISVTNTSASVTGNPVELDAELRSRQAISVELPSQTLLGGTAAGIASISNVSRYRVYENDTNVNDANLLPPHSITTIVEGGTDEDIAQQIFARKNPGCYTNGDVVVYVSEAITGQSVPIRFYRPTYVPIYVTVNIKPLNGYTTSKIDDIKNNVATYLNSLQIGNGIPISSLWGAALSALNLKEPVFSISSLVAGASNDSQSTSDITIAYNQVVQGNTDNITINVS